jgi:hypothetical protein
MVEVKAKTDHSFGFPPIPREPQFSAPPLWRLLRFSPGFQSRSRELLNPELSLRFFFLGKSARFA